MDLKDRIQGKCRELFMKFGFRSVTMDEIATQLGISKKTIYQYFKDKDELVACIIQDEITFIQTECIAQQKHSENAIQEVFKAMDSMQIIFESMNPQILFDLEKFYPDTHKKFIEHKERFLLEVIRANIARGIKEQLYRSELDLDIVSKCRLESSFLPFNVHLFPYGKYSILKVSTEIYYLFLHGMATTKGKKLIEKYIQQRGKSVLKV